MVRSLIPTIPAKPTITGLPGKQSQGQGSVTVMPSAQVKCADSLILYLDRSIMIAGDKYVIKGRTPAEFKAGQEVTLTVVRDGRNRKQRRGTK